MATKWLLRCSECGRTWYLEVSFDLSKFPERRLYHFCPYCRRNTFHQVVSRVDEE